MQDQAQPVGYFSSFVSYTKTAISNNYEKLPIKFIESTVTSTVTRLNPYLDKVSGVVDNQIEKTLQRVQPIKETVQTQITRGTELKEKLKSSLKQKSQEGVNLATQNRASQLVFDTCDKLTDKVFCSIEQRVIQLQNLMKIRPRTLADSDKMPESKKGSLKNYHKRTLNLAQQITQLSNHLFIFLKQEVVLKNEGAKVGFWVNQAKTILSSHCRASLTLIQIVTVRPMNSIYTACKEELTFILTLYNEKKMTELFLHQLEELKKMLTKEQMKNYMQLLQESLRSVNFNVAITFSHTQYIHLKKLYLEALDNKGGQKEIQMCEMQRRNKQEETSEKVEQQIENRSEPDTDVKNEQQDYESSSNQE